MKFLTKKDRKAIKAGAKLAEKHAKQIEYHQIEHSIRHELVEDFDCSAFNKDFYTGLVNEAKSQNPTGNHFFLASYNRNGERISAALFKALGAKPSAKPSTGPSMDDLTKMFPGATFVPVEPPQEGETEEQFIARLSRMAEDDERFNEQVSETGDPRKTIFDPTEDKITFTPEEEAAEPEGASGAEDEGFQE